MKLKLLFSDIYGIDIVIDAISFDTTMSDFIRLVLKKLQYEKRTNLFETIKPPHQYQINDRVYDEFDHRFISMSQFGLNEDSVIVIKVTSKKEEKQELKAGESKLTDPAQKKLMNNSMKAAREVLNQVKVAFPHGSGNIKLTNEGNLSDSKTYPGLFFRYQGNRQVEGTVGLSKKEMNEFLNKKIIARTAAVGELNNKIMELLPEQVIEKLTSEKEGIELQNSNLVTLTARSAKSGYGNCGDLTCFAFIELVSKAKDPKSIEIVQILDEDHQFIVLNRTSKNNLFTVRDLEKDPNVIIVDPWSMEIVKGKKLASLYQSYEWRNNPKNQLYDEKLRHTFEPDPYKLLMKSVLSGDAYQHFKQNGLLDACRKAEEEFNAKQEGKNVLGS